MQRVPDEFPSRFLGIIEGEAFHASSWPEGGTPFPEPTTAPKKLPHGCIRVWRVNYDTDFGFYEVYADYKGRGFVVVDVTTGKNYTGPLRLDWRDPRIVHTAVETVHRTRQHAQRVSKENQKAADGKPVRVPF